MKEPTRFWDKIADKYARQPIADEASYQKKLDITQSYFNSGTELVELGCGSGSTAVIHAPHVKHIRAVDISPRMIEIAREKAQSAGVHNVTFETARLEDFQVENASVDVVMAMSILHLIEDKEGTIARIHSMLKPGGIFVSSTICLGDEFWWLKYITPPMRAMGLMPAVLKFFTRNELENCIKSSGFDIEHSWKPGKRKAVFLVGKKR